MEENAMYKMSKKYTFVVRTSTNICVEADSKEEAIAKLSRRSTIDEFEIVGRLLNKETDIYE